MVEIKDIQDRYTLEAWLDQIIAKKGGKEGQRIAVYIASRAGMRSLPVYWRWTQTSDHARERHLTALPILRASIISGLAIKTPNPKIIEYANAAYVAYGGYAATPATFAASSAAAAAEAAYAVGAANTSAAAAAAVESVCAAAAAHTMTTSTHVWIELRLDATAALSQEFEKTPIWSDDNPLAEVWANVKSTKTVAPEDPSHWSFWLRWYDDILKGSPPRNPELLKAIALIDPADWDKGPGFINDFKIPELQAEHARHIASTAAEIVREKATSVFTEVAVSDLEDGLFRDARVRANEAIADFRRFIDRPQSPYGAFAEDLDVIQNQIARSADRPVRCYEDLADAMLIILDIAKYNGLETDSRVTRLVRNFERSRRDLRADDNKVAAREAKRIRIGYDELMDAEQADFRAMLTDFAHKSDDTLEAEMVEDEAAIADPETLPEVRDRALLRSSERMVQMDGIERDEAAKASPSLEEVGKKADAVNKVAKAGGTGFNVAAKIVEWFLT